MRKLNWVLSKSQEQDWSYSELCRIFCQLMDSNVYVVSADGKVLGVAYSNSFDTSTIVDPGTGEEIISPEHREGLLRISESMVNIHGQKAEPIFGTNYAMKEKLHCIVPVTIGEIRYGTLLFARYSPEFSQEDLALCEYGATVIGLEMKRKLEDEERQEQRLKASVEAAIESLSYSELEAIVRIFENIKTEEVVIVASKIADAYEITRSVVVNALRKLESAGVVISRSLGMKGTRIKVTNKYLIEEISKIKLD